ncbi:hypothetical protein BX600DRAFT_455164 [Xylariales sp. PMI_506]|nr:hypothetical protein BX600DRAFT_455164 [Xylariales sp. PMI_506]
MSSEYDIAQIFGIKYHPEVTSLWDLLLEGYIKNPHGLAFAALHQDRNHIQLLPSDKEGASLPAQNLEWTFEDLKQAAEVLASGLEHCGTTHSAIAAFLFPTAEWALSKWAAAKLAAPFAPLDPRMLAREEDVKAVLELLKAEIIIVHDGDAATKLDIILHTMNHQPKVKVICSSLEVPGTGWIPLTSLLNPMNSSDSSAIPHTNGLQDANKSPTGRILFTGGSTGQPKACEHSVSNLDAESAGYSTMRDLGPGSRTLIQSPCHHIMACAAALLTWRAGAAVILPGQTFNSRASLEAIEQYGVTYLPVHHSMTDALIADPAFEPHRVASVRYLQVGGALIGTDLLERYTQAFGDAKVFPLWGMTEGMYTTANGLQDDSVAREGVLAVGFVQPGARVRVADPETNAVCKRNEVGELHIGGPTVIARYMHDASPASFYEDQYGCWFKSGDQGVIDNDGRVHMLGRYKDVIKRGGENCYPALAEHQLLSKAGIKACIVGISDPVASEVPVAVISPTKEAQSFTKADIQEFLVSQLGSDYRLAAILTLEDIGIDAFPIGPGGKIRKFEVQKLAMQALDKVAASETEEGAAETNGLRSTVDRVRMLVSKHFHIPFDNIVPNSPMRRYMDSLSAARFCRDLERIAGRRIPLNAVMSAETVQDQARLCDAHATEHISKALAPVYAGPPGLSDVKCIDGLTPEKFVELRATTEAMLAPFGMDWQSHVQQIFKVPPIYALNIFPGGPNRGYIRRIFEISNIGTRHITQAVSRLLDRWHIFRSFGVFFQGQTLLARVRPCIQFRNACISYKTIAAEEVSKFYEDFSRNHCGQGPKPPHALYRIQIVQVAGTETTLLVMSMNHALFDAAMMEPLLGDLDNLLKDLNFPLNIDHVDYKLWADMYHGFETSRTAMAHAEYQAQVLSGFSKLSAAVWPPLEKEPVPAAAAINGQTTEVKSAKPDEEFKGFVKFSPLEERTYPGLPQLHTQHGIRPFAAVKAAVSLMNWRKTGQPHALFMDNSAGRQWPFQDEFVQDRLPNPWSVMGPTYAPLFNKIDINMDESCLSFMTRLHEHMTQVVERCHAPMGAVVAKLGAEAALLTKYFSTQKFNLTLDVRSFLGYKGPNGLLLQKGGGAFPVGRSVYWQCSVYGGDTLALISGGDDSAANIQEIIEAQGDVFKFMGLLTEPDNWNRPLKEVLNEPSHIKETAVNGS